MVLNVVSVDVEEYFHAAIFRNGTSGLVGYHFESRIDQSIDRLLALLEHHHTNGTFFVLGEIAATHPAVVRRIAAHGHEVACHSDRHEDVHRQSPREFRADIHRAKDRLENLVGDAVIGFRAPNFSIGRRQSWRSRPNLKSPARVATAPSGPRTFSSR